MTLRLSLVGLIMSYSCFSENIRKSVAVFRGSEWKERWSH